VAFRWPWEPGTGARRSRRRVAVKMTRVHSASQGSASGGLGRCVRGGRDGNRARCGCGGLVAGARGEEVPARCRTNRQRLQWMHWPRCGSRPKLWNTTARHTTRAMGHSLGHQNQHDVEVTNGRSHCPCSKGPKSMLSWPRCAAVLTPPAYRCSCRRRKNGPGGWCVGRSRSSSSHSHTQTARHRW
jgi:hypothetical protein